MTAKYISVLGVIALTACGPQPGVEQPTQSSADEVITLGAIETSTSGACFAKTAGPTETVVIEELLEVAPAVKDRNGVVVSPAVFRNVSRPATNTVGDGERFETVCPPALTPAFVATLQRAMITRRAYSGAVNGQYDTATGLAVQRFQREQGIDSPYLAVSTARQLGVLAVERDSL
ncbi:Putative peptidoglycan binding domain-containing protein [Cognatiyoonia koreensis]|uniref:Putative peptidoglycan binding domain-containing protein n=1 Tax=Cognatiyoonia koreensis TaxID=364200 RepID=A0A1I0Q5V7_9RHOB|nr:peptidoglycan-binding domain-containing protein [Cognatiyoonia koreensis]SEW22155.1 Putative peptidoglycan binding domain-containing protein [Cognatiyoonia koreensis]